ncbi:MAG: DUF4097 family beta strand repeat protein [Verrucomicrobiae bacterium]|nr:DUF4097 family beta strand repeat protein [Verrucomicrobiae bacterium]
MRFHTSLPMLALASFLVLPSRAADPQADTLQRTFPANPGGRLILDADRGSISIEGTDAAEVHIEVERRVSRGTLARAAALLDQHQVHFSESDGTLRIKSEGPDTSLWGWRRPQLNVAFRIRVPRSFHIDAKTAGGSIRVTQLAGEVSIRTAGGSLHLEDVRGTVVGRTSGGSIRATRLEGDIELGTSGGGIQIEQISGTRLKTRTSGGSIRLAGINVPAEAHTSGGGLDIEAASAPLQASTSGGSIRARFSTAPRADVSLRTSGGSINVTLPNDAALELDAATSAGSVQCDFPVTVSGTVQRNALRGPIGGGGPLLTLRTSGGSIRVQRP